MQVKPKYVPLAAFAVSALAVTTNAPRMPQVEVRSVSRVNANVPSIFSGTSAAPTAQTRLVEVGDEFASDEDVRNYVSSLWAEDWDSAEDAVYDTW